jgi:hypothetical protein
MLREYEQRQQEHADKFRREHPEKFCPTCGQPKPIA